MTIIYLFSYYYYKCTSSMFNHLSDVYTFMVVFFCCESPDIELGQNEESIWESQESNDIPMPCC